MLRNKNGQRPTSITATTTVTFELQKGGDPYALRDFVLGEVMNGHDVTFHADDVEYEEVGDEA